MAEPEGTAGQPTLLEVAARAGVSRSTASRAINGEGRVSPETRAAVAAAVAELGFTPNRAARSLKTRRTGLIALVVPEPDEFALGDPFVAAILAGLSNTLDDSDVRVELVVARPGRTERTVRFLRGGHVDGAVVVSHHRSGALVAHLADPPLPVVFIGRPATDRPGAHFEYVDTDNLGGGRLATEHLIARGCRRIGIVTGPVDMVSAMDRRDGWAAALAAAGLPDDAVATGDFTLPGGRAATHLLLDAHPDLDGIVVCSDLMAAGALAALASRGRNVPDDIAVTGYDNLGLAANTAPPLTTVVQPVVEMARAAASRLLELLAGAGPREPVVFPAELVVRRSA